ncbi:MAG: type II toxin-antitoxin system RelE/ParE family toxin, partial [Acetobacteraceae bacterium]
MVPQVAKLLRKERLPDAALCKPAREVLVGLLGAGEAALGARLFKKRLARLGGGKSGGYRAIVAYRPPRADRVLVTYAFAKNAASTLTPQGHE